MVMAFLRYSGIVTIDLLEVVRCIILMVINLAATATAT